MSGFENDVVFALNADFTQADNQAPVEANGLVTDGQIWVGSTATNAGGTHINVGSITSPDSSVTIGYSSPNITLQVAGGSAIETINGDSGSITGSTVTIYANNAANNAGSTVKFVNSGTTSTLNVTDSTLFNTFVGASAGKLTTTGNVNSSFGYQAMTNLTSGVQNDSFGYRSLWSNLTGNSNCAMGHQSLFNCAGSDNTACGHSALFSYAGSNATAVGSSALLNTSGTGNTAVGYLAGRSITTGTNNIAIGFIALVNGGASSQNVGIGYQALQNCTGNTNTAIGYNAGSAYNTTEAGNLLLGNVAGTAGESNVTRIGNAQTTAFIAGVKSVAISNPLNVVINSSTGQLGTIAGNPIQEATVVLTSSEIKNLNGTPIALVAAQGAGKVIVPVSITGKFLYGGTNVFVAAASQTVSVFYGTAL